MINRRHIRIKVMQSVYAMLQTKSDNLIKEEKFLLESIQKMNDLYILMLSLLIEVHHIAERQINLSKKKFLATSEDLNPNTKFIQNKVFKILNESEELSRYLEDKKLNNWYLDSKYVSIIWKNIQKNKAYIEYLSTEKSSFKEDKELIITLFKECIAPNEKLFDYYESTNLSWVDDIPVVNTWVLNTISKLKENCSIRLARLYKDDEDKRFVIDLFRKVMLHHHEFDVDIDAKTPNWDTERIAELDLILMKMAITEFFYFPTIPTKVTINEYIELAKEYSTGKSSFFINGILDKLLKQYLKKDKVRKIGRGLL